MIETGVAMVRLKAFCTFCGVAPLSVTRIVKLNEPSAVGVPLKCLHPMKDSVLPGKNLKLVTMCMEVSPSCG